MSDLSIKKWQDPTSSGSFSLSFTGAVTIENAQKVKQSLLDVLTEATELQLDFSLVSEIDLTGLQLISATRDSAHISGVRVTAFDGGNSNYIDAVSNAGFQRFVS